MNDRQLRTIENVTANFFFWQGLRWVPLGAAMLLWVTLPGSVAGARRSGIVVVAMIAALWISERIGHYYSRTYGNVLAARNERRERWKWNFVYPVMIASLVADGLWKPPLLLSGLVWSAAIILYWNSTG